MPTLEGQLQLAISQSHEMLSVLAHVRDTGRNIPEGSKLRQRIEVAGAANDLGHTLAGLISKMKEDEDA